MTRRLLLFALLLASTSALATVPGQIAFQGLLTDDLGSPLTATVTIDFGLFESAAGGTALWTESHPGTPVVDGVYDVQLGSITPLTPALLTGSTVYLEIAVDGETFTPRKQLLAVPYALTAAEATSVGSVDAAVMTQMWMHGNFDGEGPDNDDPIEGLLDSDGDGIANFLEPDNDDDGVSDADEINVGTAPNLYTPVITSVTPNGGEAIFVTSVHVSGTGFRALQTVAIGSQTPTQQNLTSTGFDIDVGPQAVNSTNLVISDPSGESDSAPFSFFDTPPVIASLSPNFAGSTVTSVVTVNGSGFLPGLMVQFGSETPTPTSFTPTSFDVSVGPQPVGTVTVLLTNPNSTTDSADFDFFLGPDPRFAFVTADVSNGNLNKIAGANSFCQGAATDAGLPGTYAAWIGHNVISQPVSRFNPGGPYLRTDFAIIADDFADLTDGTLDVPINVDETGNAVTGTILVSTNVNDDGTFGSANEDCLDWDTGSSNEVGRVGDLQQTDASWTDSALEDCSLARRLYCFQQ
jgi:hypothetical protein